jgi:hypothetical protein
VTEYEQGYLQGLRDAVKAAAAHHDRHLRNWVDDGLEKNDRSDARVAEQATWQVVRDVAAMVLLQLNRTCEASEPDVQGDGRVRG